MSFCRQLLKRMGCSAGPSAIHYFEEAFPEVTPFGSKGLYHNKAEWIVDLTTKARRLFLGSDAPWTSGRAQFLGQLRAMTAIASCNVPRLGIQVQGL